MGADHDSDLAKSNGGSKKKKSAVKDVDPPAAEVANGTSSKLKEEKKKKKKKDKEAGEEEDEIMVPLSSEKKIKKRKAQDAEDAAAVGDEVTPKKSKKVKAETNGSSGPSKSGKEQNGAASEVHAATPETAAPVKEEENPFAVTKFRISENIRLKLKQKGIEALFPIQAQTFDVVVDGNDLVGRARTGQVSSRLLHYGRPLAFLYTANISQLRLQIWLIIVTKILPLSRKIKKPVQR